jgi:hypothetical protein
METITDQPVDTGAEPCHCDQREAVLTKLITSLPGLLAKCDEFDAATIIAGLLKVHMNRHAPEAEPTDDLDAAVRRAREEAERDVEYAYRPDVVAAPPGRRACPGA